MSAHRCPKHDAPMLYGGVGYVRCPRFDLGCNETRRTLCGAFIRRQRPQGRTITCQAPVEVETYAVGLNGERVYHGGRCARHPDTKRYVAPGWRVEFVRAPQVPPAAEPKVGP